MTTRKNWQQASFWPLLNTDLAGQTAPNLPVGVGRSTDMLEIDSSASFSHELLAPSDEDHALCVTELSLQVGAECELVLAVEDESDALGRWDCSAKSGPAFDWQLSPRVLPKGKKLLATTSVSTTVKGHKAWFEVAP